MAFLEKIKKFLNSIKNKGEKQLYLPEHKQDEIRRKDNGGEKTEIEYFTNNAGKLQFYDVTKIQVDFNKFEIVEGRPLYECGLLWKNDSDAVMFDETTGQEIEKYIKVKTFINKNLLYNDQEYVKALATSLLDKKRVEAYLQRGMEENPEIKSGNYVGEIDKNQEGKYVKRFHLSVGKTVHNSNEMTKRREVKKRKEENKKEVKQNEIKEQIEKLKAQQEELERE